MKAAPFAVLGAAVLAGWVSSPLVAFAHPADAASASARREPGASPTGARGPMLWQDLSRPLTLAHASTCTCAACCATAKATR
jgi:hypothetical protein